MATLQFDKGSEAALAETALAREILDFAHDALLVRLRFLEPAFAKLELVRHDAPGHRTNGAALFFDPAAVVAAYAADAAAPARTYLHMVLHCVFRHQFAGTTYRAALWDLAADIAVESCIADLGLAELETEGSRDQRAMLASLANALDFITAETVYAHFEEAGMSDEEAVRARKAFFADAHDGWVRGSRAASAVYPGEEGEEDTSASVLPTHGALDQDKTDEGAAPETPQPRAGEPSAAQDEPHPADQPGTAPDQETGSALDEALAALAARGLAGAAPDAVVDAAGGMAVPDACARAMSPDAAQVTRPLPTDTFTEAMQTSWRSVAVRAQVALDDFAQLWGAAGGGFKAALRAAAVPRANYEDFLRRFVSRNESMQINDGEFDYAFYCYGLDLYGTVPLIEPLEYTDEGRIRDFVIAIDTSASTKGTVVEGFLARTFDVLETCGAFADVMNVHVVQCDAQLQDARLIRTRADARRLRESFEVKGFGGTDFRPVFSYVETLRAQGTLENLKGLLYFTDGHGAYPTHPPDYDVAFVLTDSAFLGEPDVPAWAMRVNVDTAEFTQAAGDEGSVRQLKRGA